MNHPDRILVVEDDQETRELLQNYLEKNGFKCMTAAHGGEMRQVLAKESPDAVVMDLMLPGEDGLQLCRDLRARENTANLPIIMLTARGEDTDRIIGLEMGADDYLPKPFNPRELLARIKSVLRRARADPPERHLPDPPLRFAGWILEPASRRLRSPKGILVPLSKGEYTLLRIFLAHPQTVLDRDALMELYRGRDASPFERSIDVQIGRLRKRLREDEHDEELIQTVWGQGYMLSCPVEAA